LDFAQPETQSRLAQVFSILSSLLVGIVLLAAPWTSLWDANYLLQPHAGIRALLLSPVTRGAVSGLGLVNILLAFHEARQFLSGGSEGR
jgi:hypothetical protein